jgi:hypothetical protein
LTQKLLPDSLTIRIEKQHLIQIKVIDEGNIMNTNDNVRGTRGTYTDENIIRSTLQDIRDHPDRGTLANKVYTRFAMEKLVKEGYLIKVEDTKGPGRGRAPIRYVLSATGYKLISRKTINESLMTPTKAGQEKLSPAAHAARVRAKQVANVQPVISEAEFTNMVNSAVSSAVDSLRLIIASEVRELFKSELASAISTLTPAMATDTTETTQPIEPTVTPPAETPVKRSASTKKSSSGKNTQKEKAAA